MRTRRALSVAELLVATAVLTVIGAAAVGLSYALSSAHAHGRDYYVHLHTARNGTARVQRLFRDAQLVTAADSDDAVLWADDGNRDGYINRDEVALLEYERSSNELGLYRVDLSDLSETEREMANNRLYLSDLRDLYYASQAVRSDPRVTYTPVATGVPEFELSCSPSPPLTTLVGVRLVAGPTGEDSRPAVLRTAAALRACQADRVVWTGSYWTLSGAGGTGEGEED